jgi:hypothetical protein
MENTDQIGEYKLENHHFAYFTGCCQALVKLTGQLDWEVSYLFLESDDETPRASMLVHDRFNRLASIQLYDSWEKVPSEFHLWKTAFHEVAELLMSDVHCLAMDRDFDYNTYDREHHRIIRILEVAWFDWMWKYGHEIFNFQSSAKGRGDSRPPIPDLDCHVSLPCPGVPKNKQSKK